MSPEPFIWAGDEFDRGLGDEHYLVVGASGSGKSTLINHVLHSVVSDPDVRALVYDPKQELVPFLYGIRDFTPTGSGKIFSSVVLLHPFDARGAAWNMAADIDSPISARQLATILVSDPESGGGSSEGFFTSAVRDILAGILLAFIECVPTAGKWTFRDVLLTLLYEPYLNFILDLKVTRGKKAFPLLYRLKTSYFGETADPRTRANIRATINAKLAVYEPVAAAWHQASQQDRFGGWFSLQEWVDESPGTGQPGSILVLGNDESARAALDPINQALFRRATELVLARRERTAQEKQSGENQIWFFLDEVREAGKLDGLGRLLTKGRSKNACVVMGFQDIDGMREVYGKEVANEICAQFNNAALLRVNSPETAQWASDLFGRRLDSAGSSSSAFSLGAQPGMSSTTGESEQERPFLYTDAFLFGSNAGVAKKVRGYRKAPDIAMEGLSREECREALKFVEETQAPRASEDEVTQRIAQALGAAKWEKYRPLAQGFVRRATKYQYLEPWDQKDWERLGLDTIVPDVISWEITKAPTEPEDNTQGAAKPPPPDKDKGAVPRNIPGKVGRGPGSIFSSDAVRPVDDIGRTGKPDA